MEFLKPEKIVFDVNKTLAAFEKKHLTLSWSSYDAAKTCEGLWFVRTFAKPSEKYPTAPIQREGSRSIPGTILQRLFESFVNDRIFNRPNFLYMGDILRWAEMNLEALFHLSAFRVDQQFEPEFKWTKDYFQKAHGFQKMKEIRDKYKLDPVFKSVELSFIDWDIFNSVYGSKENLLKRLKDMLPKILELFLEQKINLMSTLSEVYLRVEHGPFTLTGNVDFIHNKENPIEFLDIKNIQDGYEVFDGKYNLSAYVKDEQLKFYSALIYKGYKKIPGRMFFLEWSKGKTKDVSFSQDYVQSFQEDLNKIQQRGIEISHFLKSNMGTDLDVFGANFLKLSADKSSCTYCPGVEFCPSAKEKGITVFKASEQTLLKKETMRDILSKGVDPFRSVKDITL
ncbi:MAG: PD-(D/E)XK nuclease family protein [Candidatus Pacearchaeota archaeon]